MTPTGPTPLSPNAVGVAVITLAHGRHDHLRAQLNGLRRGTAAPDHFVVAAMNDEQIARVVGEGDPPSARVTVVDITAPGAELPLATARNQAAKTAVAAGADVLIFLDVDCIPAPDLVETYARACRGAVQRPVTSCTAEAPGVFSGPEVFSGPVHYLQPPATSSGYTDDELRRSRPHPARPVVRHADVEAADDLRLFWSLSFATTARSWAQVGGFDEGYSGYGGEDTDYAMLLDRAGGRLWWVRDAVAYHQHHDIENPPRRHLESIIRNSNRFHQRWGTFPMVGWLAAFEADGLITQNGSPPRWSLSSERQARRPIEPPVGGGGG